MTQAILNQILNQLEALEPEELQQLNQAIQKHLVAKDTVETKFHQALLTSGLIKQSEKILFYRANGTATNSNSG